MKSKISIVLLLIAAHISAQQSTSLEQSVTGLQLGFFGAEVYNEAKLSDQVSLRGQLSLLPSVWGGDFYSKTGFALAPALSVTPKYYYNLAKRVEKGKNIKNNAANYIASRTAICAELVRDFQCRKYQCESFIELYSLLWFPA